MTISPTKEEFASLFAEHHHRLFGFVRSLTPHMADAEEVFQETCVVLWREFERYDTERPFAPWALAIARNQALSYRRRQRQRQALFSEALISELSTRYEEMAEELTERRTALRQCLERLSPADRKLLAACYAPESEPADGARASKTFRTAAEELGRPVNTVYKALRRIRESLGECVNRRLSLEERG